MPSLAIVLREYCPRNWATPRTANTPIRPRGTNHSGSVPSEKPWSSSGCIKAAISGSVPAPTRVASTAMLQARRWRPK